jgi:hypothetical protein
MRKITEKQVVEMHIKNCSNKTELLEKIKEELKGLPETAKIQCFNIHGIAVLGSRWE